MSTQLPSPPSSRPATPPADHKPDQAVVQDKSNSEPSLSQRLDHLLESYLELLDTYTTLRDQVSKDLSAGFFSLASANRNSTLGPGRRYGEEGYDQRMKASRTVQIVESTRCPPSKAATKDREDSTEKATSTERTSATAEHQQPSAAGTGWSTEHQQTSPAVATETNDTTVEHKQQEGSPIEDDTPPHTASSHSTHDTSHLPPSHTYSIRTSTPPAPSKDPLKWYGILVPPSLRQCQTQFQHAVSSTFPDLVNTMSEMRILEEQVGEIRRALGLLEGYERQHTTSKAVSGGTSTEKAGEEDDDSLLLSALSLSKDGTGSRQEPSVTKASSLLSPSSPTRPAEPRSRILKLG